MKKTLLAAMLLLNTLAASAQVWIGGQLAFRSSDTTLGDFHMGANNSFETGPEAGYQTRGAWAFGLRLGYAHYDDAEVTIIDQTMRGQTNQLSLEPFARYTLYRSGPFSLFADGALGYKAVHKSDYDSALSTVGVSLSAGMAYQLGKRFALTARLGRAGYAYSWVEDRGSTLSNHTVDASLLGSLTIGAQVWL